MSESVILDKKDGFLMEIFQKNFPLVTRPFKKIGNTMKISEEEVIGRTKKLIENGFLKYIGPLFNSKRLGFKSALIALKIKGSKISDAAYIINSHPGVSHNYKRGGEYSLWFTLTVPPGVDMNQTVKIIKNHTEADDSLILESLKTYKLKVNLPVVEKTQVAQSPEESDNQFPEPVYFDRVEPVDLNSEQISILKELENGIEISPEPFELITKKKKISGETVLETLRSMMKNGVIRRFSGIPHHRKIGYTYNVMVVWVVDETKIDEIGRKVSEFPSISHCYKRTTYEKWPFNLYTMIHTRNEDEALNVIKKIIITTGIETYALLPTIEEYKKSRIRYFSSEHYIWEEKLSG